MGSAILRTPRNIILLSEGWLHNLYLATALQREGFDVVIVHPRGRFSGLRAFLSIKTQKVSGFSVDELNETVDPLCAGGFDGWIIPLSESLVRLCQEPGFVHRSLVWQWLSAHGTTLAQDKGLMSAWARSVGITTPEQLVMPNREQALDFCDRHGYPVVVKGAMGSSGSRVKFAYSEADLDAAMLELKDERPTLQQFMHGPTIQANGLFDGGKAVCLQVCETVTQHPAPTGPATVVRTMLPGAIAPAVDKLMQSIGSNGFASTDWILQDGAYYFLEVNPRPWGSITAGTASGLDFYRPFARMLRGQSVSEQPEQSDAGALISVYPTYLAALASQGSLAVFVRGLADKTFWRGIPREPTALFLYVVLRNVLKIWFSRETPSR